MTTVVSHNYAGNVIVVNFKGGERFDLSPETAETAAAECEKVLANGTGRGGFVVIKAHDDRKFRIAGNRDELAAMADDLRHHAERARSVVLETD
jgi:ribosomal protein S4E